MASPFLDLVLAMIGFVLLWRIPGVPSARGAAPPARVSVIVPARNEERRIAPLLRSLAAQRPPPHETIVVDDDSADGTVAVAEEFGVTVIRGRPLPEGWNGKPFACWQGARAATGDLLLFVDADTWLEPSAVAALAEAHGQRGGLVSVWPYHVVQQPYEQLSAFFNAVLMAGVGVFTPLRGLVTPPAAFGPCLLCSREEYELVGGHEALRAEILEDIGVARAFARQRLPVSLYGGRGVVSFRMYPEGFDSLLEGWTRSIAIGASSLHPLMIVLVAAWITGLCACALAPLRVWTYPTAIEQAIAVISYLVAVAQTRWVLARLGTFRWWVSALFPLFVWFFAAVTARSLLYNRLLRRIRWKGRDIRTSSINAADGQVKG